jgi:hypothetical protein
MNNPRNSDTYGMRHQTLLVYQFQSFEILLSMQRILVLSYLPGLYHGNFFPSPPSA